MPTNPDSIEPIILSDEFKRQFGEYVPLTEAMLLELLGEITEAGDFGSQSGSLVRLAALEGSTFLVPNDWLTANPNQPRKDFDYGYIEGLMRNIAEVGLRQPIEVVPFIDGRRVRFFIIDGECRCRGFNEILKLDKVPIIVKWEKDEDDIFMASFTVNIERSGHNPIEIAIALSRVFSIQKKRFPDITGSDLYERIRKITGFKHGAVRRYLKLLDFPPDVQRAIAKGLPPAAFFNVIRRPKRGRIAQDEAAVERERQMHAAALLLEEINTGKMRDEDSSTGGDGKPRRVTKDQLAAARRRAILEGASADERLLLDIQSRVWGVANSVQRALLLADSLEKDDHNIVVSAMRNMGDGKPPEQVRDRILLLVERLRVLLMHVEEAVNPLPLMPVPGQSSYAVYIARQLLQTGIGIGENEKSLLMALAEASDAAVPTVYTAHDLERITEIPVAAIGGIIQRMKQTLERFALVIDSHPVRRKDARGDYKKFGGMRLAYRDIGVVPQPSPVTASVPAVR